MFFTLGLLDIHDLKVTLEAPGGVLYEPDMEPIIIVASTVNTGSYNEFDVEFQFWINDTLVYDIVYSTLDAGSSVMYFHSWTPSVCGIYNITTYVVPVINEETVQNNRWTTIVTVGYPKIDFNLGDYIYYEFINDGQVYPYGTFTYEV